MLSCQSGNIFLIGPMGAGKTTIGRQLARSMAKEFHDSDREIEARTGASVALIFDIEGEAGFRRRESKIIDELTLQQNMVLATGGGAVIDAYNRECMKTRGITVYLRASVDRLFTRTRRDINRPLLQTADPKHTLQELLRHREPLYREVADLVINTDGRTLRQVITEIRHFVEQR
ncbi:MAG: shikimate kinase AroK [Chromatiales bacterium]